MSCYTSTALKPFQTKEALGLDLFTMNLFKMSSCILLLCEGFLAYKASKGIGYRVPAQG